MAEPVPSEFIARVAARLAARRAEKLSAPVSRSTYDTLYETAAVLSWFDPRKLSPSDDPVAQERLDKLLADSTQTLDPSGARRWTLSPDVRIRVLRQLREGGHVREMLAATPQRPDDHLQQALERCLTGKPVPVEEQSLEELGASFQVCDWLRQAGFEGLPDRELIQQRIEWLTLLQPFEHLAGKHFRGRVRELQVLREYAGVLPPGSVYEATRRFVEEIFNLKDKPPLVIYGPGGVGKSTLVARFILEHARALEHDRFPFAYLDFDRPDVESQEPLTLLAEAVRQLGIEYPQARESCERIRQGWLDVLAKAETNASPDSPSREGVRVLSAAVRDFSTLIDSLGAQDRPVLFVLDTFEEVQWRSEQHVTAIWRLLQELQPAVTRLRVVVVGRANISGRRTKELQLTGLDEEAAIGYLQARGIIDRQVAHQLVDQFGGSPLSLQLAVELFQREGLDERGRLNVETRNFFFSRMDDALIQRQLYKRILGHVHDEEVRKLAHPGLLLRRLTPELILEVLAEPCCLEISSLEEAWRLFDKLRREVSLVTVAPDGALEHRQDLRRLMLELLEADQPEKTAAIHQRAVRYYERQPPSPDARAEEIYHRLALGQTLSDIRRRWLRGVESHLKNAPPEFKGAQLAFLAARLKMDVDEETLRAAELEDWERIVGRKVRELLSQGRQMEALELLTSRDDRTDRSSLFSLAAKAHAQLGRYHDALEVLMEGIDRASSVSDRRRELSLTLQATEIIMASGTMSPAPQIIGRVADWPRRSLPIADRVNLFAHLSALSRVEPALVPFDDRYLIGNLRASFDAVSDAALIARPSVARWAALSFSREDVGRLSRVLRLTGLPRGRARALRHLAVELTSLDVAISREIGAPPGALAQKIGVPSYDFLIDSWTRFVLKARNKKDAEALCRVLDEYASYVQPSLIEAVRNIMRYSLGLDLTDEDEEFTERDITRRYDYRYNPRISDLTPGLRARLVDALSSAFTTEELSEFLVSRLERRLESITRLGSLRAMVVDLVRTAETQGWLTEFIAKAHESRPGDATLAEVAEQVGLSLLSSANIISSITRHQKMTSRDPSVWRERLGTIEAQVCRIERRGEGVGTGFLVGVDLVLTASHVVEELYSRRSASGELQVRFDYKVDRRGQAVTTGTMFGLDKDWLVAQREYGEGPDQLDYAILRVSNSPGAQPIGGARAEASAALRKWIEVTARPPLVVPGEGLIMVHHLATGPLKLELDPKAVIAISPDNARVYHTLITDPGSSGAPCFNYNFELVAFNSGLRSHIDSAAPQRMGVGILMGAVLQDLKERGLGELLSTRFV